MKRDLFWLGLILAVLPLGGWTCIPQPPPPSPVTNGQPASAKKTLDTLASVDAAVDTIAHDPKATAEQLRALNARLEELQQQIVQQTKDKELEAKRQAQAVEIGFWHAWGMWLLFIGLFLTAGGFVLALGKFAATWAAVAGPFVRIAGYAGDVAALVCFVIAYVIPLIGWIVGVVVGLIALALLCLAGLAVFEWLHAKHLKNVKAITEIKAALAKAVTPGQPILKG